MAKRPRKSSKLKDAEVFLGDVGGLRDDLSALKASRKRKAPPLSHEDIYQEDAAYAAQNAPGPMSMEDMLASMRGDLDEKIQMALNDPNATDDQLRFRRDLAKNHPKALEMLVSGADPGDVAHLLVKPSIESRGPSKAAKALRERQHALAQKKLKAERAADLAAGGLTGEPPIDIREEALAVDFPEYERSVGYEPGGSNYEAIGRAVVEATKEKAFTGKGSGKGVETLLAAAGVTSPGALQKMVAGLVGKTPVAKLMRAKAGGAKLGKLASGASWVGKQAVHSPVGTALTALAALQMLAPGVMDKVTSPVKEMTGGDSAIDLFLNNTGISPGQPTFAGRLKNQGQLAALQDEMRLRAERDARTAAQNTALLFQTAPHVAAQIMAGRRLPKGAVVIGGTPRVDLMQEMAMQMGQGQFEQQDPMQSILERQQGGGT